jgi:hypothetical protein
MIVTEDEASSLWCPQGRVLESEESGNGLGAASTNRYLGSKLHDADPRCFASKCMFWRWDDADHGHCGLAGPASRYEQRTRAAAARTKVEAHQRRLAQAERELEEITRERGASKHE